MKYRGNLKFRSLFSKELRFASRIVTLIFVCIRVALPVHCLGLRIFA
jgi:hypothetical protein